MDIIELEHGVPDPENPGRVKYAGQLTAQEVFEELKYRLESMGYLPDEYFVMDSELGIREIGRQIGIYRHVVSHSVTSLVWGCQTAAVGR